jgi:hypothetical protein
MMIEFMNARPGQTGRVELIESLGDDSGPWRSCHVKFHTAGGLEAGRIRIDFMSRKPVEWESDADRARKEDAFEDTLKKEAKAAKEKAAIREAADAALEIRIHDCLKGFAGQVQSYSGEFYAWCMRAVTGGPPPLIRRLP